MTDKSSQPNSSPVQGPPTSPWAIVSLVSGIASYLFLPFVGAVVALVAGYISKRDICNSHGTLEGDSLATAGLVLGWVNVALSVLAFCLILFLGLALLGVAAIGPVIAH